MRRTLHSGLALTRVAGLIVLSVSGGSTLFLKTANAQDTVQQTAQEKVQSASKGTKAASVYRVDYVLHELQNGKRTNTRNYTLMVSGVPMGTDGGNWTGFHVGSRVPVSVGHESWQYFDLGVKINCRLKEREGNLLVETSMEVNSVAAPESGSGSTSASPASAPPNPVIRNLSLASSTQTVSGKPALVGSVDDVTANRRYEIEVIPTKAK